ncbi:hypothetical protein [Geomonas sp.]|uniref:hypothetical protein n=1 Tax=Geomonas sp. TaxID=2651584 RepID=UPI002B491FE6|nr:hypothetical protein [Geomonas sp.]HJV36902.1 hypothetical protein [Geomonas sp.]
MKVPVGLKVLAVLNFFFAALILISLFFALWSPQMRQQGGSSLAYAILSPGITGTLLLISGVGFLRLSYLGGFVTGIVCSIFSLGNSVVFNAMKGVTHLAMYIPSMIYPLVTLLLLTLKYRGRFKRS